MVEIHQSTVEMRLRISTTKAIIEQKLNSIYSMQLNRSIPNLRAADTIKSRLNLVHGNLSKVLLHMRLS